MHQEELCIGYHSMLHWMVNHDKNTLNKPNDMKTKKREDGTQIFAKRRSICFTCTKCVKLQCYWSYYFSVPCSEEALYHKQNVNTCLTKRNLFSRLKCLVICFLIYIRPVLTFIIQIQHDLNKNHPFYNFELNMIIC